MKKFKILLTSVLFALLMLAYGCTTSSVESIRINKVPSTFIKRGTTSLADIVEDLSISYREAGSSSFTEYSGSALLSNFDISLDTNISGEQKVTVTPKLGGSVKASFNVWVYDEEVEEVGGVSNLKDIVENWNAPNLIVFLPEGTHNYFKYDINVPATMKNLTLLGAGSDKTIITNTQTAWSQYWNMRIYKPGHLDSRLSVSLIGLTFKHVHKATVVVGGWQDEFSNTSLYVKNCSFYALNATDGYSNIHNGPQLGGISDMDLIVENCKFYDYYYRRNYSSTPIIINYRPFVNGSSVIERDNIFYNSVPANAGGSIYETSAYGPGSGGGIPNARVAFIQTTNDLITEFVDAIDTKVEPVINPDGTETSKANVFHRNLVLASYQKITNADIRNINKEIHPEETENYGKIGTYTLSAKNVVLVDYSNANAPVFYIFVNSYQNLSDYLKGFIPSTGTIKLVKWQGSNYDVVTTWN